MSSLIRDSKGRGGFSLLFISVSQFGMTFMTFHITQIGTFSAHTDFHLNRHQFFKGEGVLRCKAISIIIEIDKNDFTFLPPIPNFFSPSI
jgi:hypothetical protein